MPIWFSEAGCHDTECDFKLAFSPDLAGVTNKAREHRDETGHAIYVNDRRQE